MIARVWRATATQSGAAQYARHFHDHVLSSLQRIDGYRAATLLQHSSSQRVEILVISFWSSEDSIRAFAGPDVRRAVVADDARRMLESCEETVEHFAVVAQDVHPGSSNG
jgi:heme-degrading monooxygenase HmoA